MAQHSNKAIWVLYQENSLPMSSRGYSRVPVVINTNCPMWLFQVVFSPPHSPTHSLSVERWANLLDAKYFLFVDKVTPGATISVGKEAFLCTEIYFNPRDRLIDNQLSRRRQCEYPARSTKNDIRTWFYTSSNYLFYCILLELAPGEDVGVPQRIINAIQKLPAELR